MKKLVLAIALLVPVSSMAANRGGGFNVGLSGLIYNFEATGDDFTVASVYKNTFLNFKLGYLMSNSIYVGLVQATLNSNDGTNTGSRSATGAQVGYHSDGYFLDFTYFLQGESKPSSALAYTGGTGMGLEVGYNTMVSSNFYLGAELNYQSITYSKREVAGVSTSRSNTFTEMYPMLNAGFMF